MRQQQATRLLDVDPATLSLYQQQTFSFDKSAVNSGSDLTYQALNGNNRIKIVLSGQGVIDLKNTQLVFRYQPTGLTARAPIYATDITSLFEVESFQINTTSLITGSSRSDLFNSIMRLMQPKSQKENDWLMGSDQGQLSISSAELQLNGANGQTILLKPLQQKAYEKTQAGRLMNAYRHYQFTGTAAQAISAPDRQMANVYSVRLADIIPAIASMGEIGNRFPLAFVQQISIGLRLVEPGINHVLAAHVWNDSTSSAVHSKSALNYTISDVQLLRIESAFNGPQAKGLYESQLREGKIQTTYADFEHLSFDVSNNSQVTSSMPVALRDLRFVAVAFTLKPSILQTYPSTTISSAEHDLFRNDKNFPWSSGVQFLMPKIKDIYYSINGQGRFPVAQPQQALSNDIAPNFLRACIRQLIGEKESYEQGYLDYLAQQNGVFIMPFQREAFSSQALSLADQSNIMQITVVFQDAQYQPSDNMTMTNLEMHVFRVFDKQLQLGKNSSIVF